MLTPAAVEAELTERELTDAVADAVHVLTSGAARRAPCRPVGQRDVHYAAGVELA